MPTLSSLKKWLYYLQAKRWPFFITLSSCFLWSANEQAPLEALYHASTQAIIFDCDGVLVDTESMKFLAWQRALAHYDISFTLEEYLPTIGHTSKAILKMIETAKGVKISETVIEIKNSYYKSLQAQRVLPIEPVVACVQKLAQQKQRLGIKLAVASSAPKEEIVHNLKAIGLESFFDEVVSGSDDLSDYLDSEGKNKPKPYIYLETAKRLKVEARNCLVFEDTEAGVVAAAKAKMRVIAIPNSLTGWQDFSQASYVMKDYRELEALFSYPARVTN